MAAPANTRNLNPSNGHVSQLALAVAGSAASAPAFAMFGIMENVEKDNDKSENKAIEINAQQQVNMDEFAHRKSESNESGFLNESDDEDKTRKELDAATKIQAGYRGMQTRKQLKKQKNMNYMSGMLRITVHKAEKLLDKDFAGKSDPYVSIRYGETVLKSVPVENTTNPNFEFTAEFLIREQSPNDIFIEILDDDIGRDESLGCTHIDIQKADGDMKQFWRKLDGVKSGSILLSLESIQSGPKNDSYLEEEQQSYSETDLETAGLISSEYLQSRKNSAATRIQAGYKGMKARRKLKETDHNKASETEVLNSSEFPLSRGNSAATTIQAGYEGLKMLHKQKSKAKDSDASEDLQTDEISSSEISLSRENSAATKIQAGYKGMKTRKRFQKTESNDVQESGETLLSREESAATKIQAGYKGMNARNSVHETESDKEITEMLT